MRLCAILCGVFHLTAVLRSGPVKQDSGVRSATLGGKVLLRCFYDSHSAMHFSWYRQKLGGRPELLSNIYKYDEPSKIYHWLEKNPRFSVERSEGINHLHISDVQLSDSATYYCGSSYSNTVEFGDGVFLSVEGTNHVEIFQEPTTETLQAGSTVTLNCTVDARSCEEGHIVQWFQDGPNQAVVHTRTNQCEILSAQQQPPHRCVYHLQKNNLSSSDAGTYYCVAASCGRMLFGGGSKLLIELDGEEQASQIGIFFWLSVCRTGMLLFFVMICAVIFVRKRK